MWSEGWLTIPWVILNLAVQLVDHLLMERIKLCQISYEKSALIVCYNVIDKNVFLVALCPVPTIAHGRKFEGFFCKKDGTCITQASLWLTCDPGYILSGFGFLVCNGGKWDVPVPTCEGNSGYGAFT